MYTRRPIRSYTDLLPFRPISDDWDLERRIAAQWRRRWEVADVLESVIFMLASAEEIQGRALKATYPSDKGVVDNTKQCVHELSVVTKAALGAINNNVDRPLRYCCPVTIVTPKIIRHAKDTCL